MTTLKFEVVVVVDHVVIVAVAVVSAASHSAPMSIFIFFYESCQRL